MTNRNENDRAAYAGELILTSERSESMDSWATGLNNNVLVLGCFGSGKTRNFLKPNLLQCEGSYVVLDSKGRLYRKMAPCLSAHGYTVDCLDFSTMEGTIGYDPLHHVRWRKGRPFGQDIISIASALFPRSDMGDDPFWASAAAYVRWRACFVSQGSAMYTTVKPGRLRMRSKRRLSAFGSMERLSGESKNLVRSSEKRASRN